MYPTLLRFVPFRAPRVTKRPLQRQPKKLARHRSFHQGRPSIYVVFTAVALFWESLRSPFFYGIILRYREDPGRTNICGYVPTFCISGRLLEPSVGQHGSSWGPQCASNLVNTDVSSRLAFSVKAVSGRSSYPSTWASWAPQGSPGISQAPILRPKSHPKEEG